MVIVASVVSVFVFCSYQLTMSFLFLKEIFSDFQKFPSLFLYRNLLFLLSIVFVLRSCCENNCRIRLKRIPNRESSKPYPIVETFCSLLASDVLNFKNPLGLAIEGQILEQSMRWLLIIQ